MRLRTGEGHTSVSAPTTRGSHLRPDSASQEEPRLQWRTPLYAAQKKSTSRLQTGKGTCQSKTTPTAGLRLLSLGSTRLEAITPIRKPSGPTAGDAVQDTPGWRKDSAPGPCTRSISGLSELGWRQGTGRHTAPLARRTVPKLPLNYDSPSHIHSYTSRPHIPPLTLAANLRKLPSNPVCCSAPSLEAPVNSDPFPCSLAPLCVPHIPYFFPAVIWHCLRTITCNPTDSGSTTPPRPCSDGPVHTRSQVKSQ